MLRGEFIRKYVPELAALRRAGDPCAVADERRRASRRGVVIGRDYPAPVVDHAAARVVTLELYKRARGR